MNKIVHALPQKVRPLLAPLLAILLLTVIYGLVSLWVAAWVGGKVITRAELGMRMHVVQFIYDRQFGQDPNYDAKFARKYQREVLGQLAEELVFLPAAVGLATAEEMDQFASTSWEFIKAGYFQNDDSKLKESLTSLHITEEDLKAYFANNLLLTRLREQQVKDVTIVDIEVKSYYEENKVSFNLPEMVKASHVVVDTKAKAEQLLAELKAGADFAALAKANSLDKETASLGGSLRWFQKGEMQESFEKAAFALEPGEMSSVVQTTQGFHIIKMESKQPKTTREYAEVANLVKPKALEAKKDNVWNQYRRTMRGKQLILLLAR